MIDLSKFKKLFIGGIELKELYAGKKYTNQVPISTDTDGSIFNGVGYQENVRLSSSGGISSSAQNGSVTTGFIPWYGDTTYLRMKGVHWVDVYDFVSSGHYYIIPYDANKNPMYGGGQYISAAEYVGGNLNHIVTVTRDANGVETVKFSETYGTSNSYLQSFRNAKYIRITAHGKGADMIVTINEEIGTQGVLLWKGISYTNLADQTPANWLTGKRINSSGVLTDAPGWDMTNFIEISSDTKKIHIKGLDVVNAYDGTNYGRVYAYNNSKAYVDYKQPSVLPSYFYVSDYDAGVVIFDVEAARSNANMNTVVTSTYLRFGGKPISDDIIITINQEIK